MRQIFKQDGFSHLVIGVAVGVALILVIAIIPRALNSNGRAMDAQRKADLKAISVALNAYGADNHIYPPAGGESCKIGLGDCLTSALTGGSAPYIDKLPKTPLGGHYIYTPSPNGCTQGACVGYSLKTTLQNGTEYTISGPTVR